jgi:hypothetical protein
VSKHFYQKRKQTQEKEHKKFLENIRKNWTLIQVKSSDCQIIKYDALIDEKLIEKENETFLEWLSKDRRKYVNLVTEKRTKIVCYFKDNNQTERKLETIVKADNTIVEVKVKMQDYINIYIPRDIRFNEDDYYIDLEFLEEPINSF